MSVSLDTTTGDIHTNTTLPDTHSWDALPFEPHFLVMADLRPLTPAQPAQPGPISTDAGVLDAEAMRYALRAWLREEGFYDVKVREMTYRFMRSARPLFHIYIKLRRDYTCMWTGVGLQHSAG